MFGRLFGMFRRKDKAKARIESLVKLLNEKEPIVIEYHGPSKEFVSFAAEHELSYEMGELTTTGSIAELAKKELEYIFRKHGTTLLERELAGRALEYTPQQILNYHKHPLPIPLDLLDDTMSFEKQLRERAHDVNLSVHDIQNEDIDVLFNGEYPNTPRYVGYKLVLERTEKGYQPKELKIAA